MDGEKNKRIIFKQCLSETIINNIQQTDHPTNIYINKYLHGNIGQRQA